MRIFTIGFTQKTAREFFEALRASGARRVIDVRLSNSSQLAGFAKKQDLPYLLEQICGIEYIHMPILAPTPEIFDPSSSSSTPCWSNATSSLGCARRWRPFRKAT